MRFQRSGELASASKNTTPQALIVSEILRLNNAALTVFAKDMEGFAKSKPGKE